MKTVVVKKTKKKGKGVFALRNFKKGEFILRRKKGKIFKESEIPHPWKGKWIYLDKIGEGKFELGRSPDKYFNHSCNPNAYVKNRKIFAMKSIKKDHEITFDYALNNDYASKAKERCHCGSKNCRKFYPGRFFDLSKKQQKKYLPYLDIWFKKKYRMKLSKL
jgi:SET domain-containing protein